MSSWSFRVLFLGPLLGGDDDLVRGLELKERLEERGARQPSVERSRSGYERYDIGVDAARENAR